MTIDTPDMAAKFASHIDPNNGAVEKSSPPLDQAQLTTVMSMLDQISPESAEDTLDQRVANAFNKIYMTGHKQAAGITPVADPDDPAVPVGMMHPQYGFFASTAGLKKSVDTAYEAGLKDGITRTNDSHDAARDLSFSGKLEIARTVLWQQWRELTGYGVLIVIGSHYLPPLVQHVLALLGG